MVFILVDLIKLWHPFPLNWNRCRLVPERTKQSNQKFSHEYNWHEAAGFGTDYLHCLICHYLHFYQIFKDFILFDRRTLLNLPLDMISEMPLAASFFSATQRTRLIWARFRIMSAGCALSGHPTLCSAQEHLRLTPIPSIPDPKTDLLSKCTSIPSCTHI